MEHSKNILPGMLRLSGRRTQTLTEEEEEWLIDVEEIPSQQILAAAENFRGRVLLDFTLLQEENTLRTESRKCICILPGDPLPLARHRKLYFRIWIIFALYI